MIRALATGVLHGDPQVRTAANGQPFTTAKLRADGKNGLSVWVSLIAFGEQAERLAAMKDRAALSVSGRCEVSAWINKDGEAAAGLSLVIDELATLKGKPRPPRVKPTREPEAVDTGTPFDDLDHWQP